MLLNITITPVFPNKIREQIPNSWPQFNSNMGMKNSSHGKNIHFPACHVSVSVYTSVVTLTN